jgi:hypothetical protein
MAKKKNENTLQYLQMPLPSGGNSYKMTKVVFGGLNKRYTLDSGELTMENNISTNEYPYLTPSPVKGLKYDDALYDKEEDDVVMPLGLFAFEDSLLVVYRHNNSIKVKYITSSYIYKGIIKTGATEDDDVPRSIVQFNVYDTPTDTLTGNYVKKLLIFPDKVSLDLKFELTSKNPDDWTKNDINNARTDVTYCYDNGQQHYFKVETVSEKDDDGKVTYSRKIGTVYVDYFICNNMDVLVKTYTNDEEPYLPPDTASHNCYYRNISTEAQKSAETLYGAAIYKWVDDEIDSENSGWKISISPTMPNIKYATVHLSRVFGVDDDRVYASGFNDYTNWNLDTIDEYNESNSWCSPSQSNTKAGGSFTGITTFQNHVICFKRDFMHEIYNTKNPFRIQDIYAEGTIDNRTIQDVDGKLIFVSEDDVKVYTGSNPRIIGYNLNMPHYEYAVSGTDNRNYYLYCEDEAGKRYLYVYDTYTELWSEQSIENRVIDFAHNKRGMYMLCDNGYIYKMDTESYSHEWSFETDLITNKTVDIKHIKKLQMLVEAAENAHLNVYILYDDEKFDEEKRLVYTSKRTGKFPIRVKPRKTANYGFKLHVEGEGYVKLYELEISIEAGGDMYV